jgi:mono/diheme cytochrome c family protein
MWNLEWLSMRLIERFVLLCLLFIPIAASAVDDGVDIVAAGRERFEQQCGICHGLDAKGNGPFADLLKVSPPDLTILTRRNNGYFPFTDVYNAIDGRNTPLAHGNRDMPIWGTRYKRMVDGGSETLVRGLILELIVYLETLQEP